MASRGWQGRSKSAQVADLSTIQHMCSLADPGSCILILQCQETKPTRPIGVFIPHNDLSCRYSDKCDDFSSNTKDATHALMHARCQQRHRANGQGHVSTHVRGAVADFLFAATPSHNITHSQAHNKYARCVEAALTTSFTGPKVDSKYSLI